MTTTPDTPSSGPSRGRIIAARTLVVLGVVLVVVSLLSNWVKREALDPETFRSHLAGADRAPGDPGSGRTDDGRPALRERRRLGPARSRSCRRTSRRWPRRSPGLGREVIDRAATELLGRPARPDALRARRRLSRRPGRQGARGRHDAPLRRPTATWCSTSTRSSSSSATDSASWGTSPPSCHRTPAASRSSQSDELDTAQSLTQLLKSVANWIWIPTLLAWAAALWLVPGRRRKEVRAIAIGLVVAGVALLVIRRVAGSYLVDNLTQSDSVRPAVSAFWTILSDGLAEAAWVVVFIGVIGTLGAWLTGEGRARRGGAPVARPVARERRHRVGGVRRRAADRRLGAPAAPVRDDRDPRRPRRRRVRGRPAPDRARVRGGGPRAAPTKARRCRGGSPRPQPRRLRSRSSSGSRSCGRTDSSPRTSTWRRRVGSSRRRRRSSERERLARGEDPHRHVGGASAPPRR